MRGSAAEQGARAQAEHRQGGQIHRHGRGDEPGAEPLRPLLVRGQSGVEAIGGREEALGQRLFTFWRVNPQSDFIVLETVVEQATYFTPMTGQRVTVTF